MEITNFFLSQKLILYLCRYKIDMQGILVTIIFVAALAYLGFILYKNFKGEAGCSTNCGCDSPVHQFKKKAEAKS